MPQNSIKLLYYSDFVKMSKEEICKLYDEYVILGESKARDGWLTLIPKEEYYDA